MANVIIGIHGLGNKPSKRQLRRWWKLAMKEGLKTNNYPSVLPKFKLVYWADVMHEKVQKITEQDENSPCFLREKYIEAPDTFPQEDHTTRKKLVDFIGKQMNRILLNKDLTLNYSFISDTIVSRFFKDLEIYYKEDCTDTNDKQCKAKDIIKGRLIRVLEKYKSDRIMLISHSMGSIVAFDVINFHTLDIPINTFITAGSPLGLPVVISKIAAEQKQKLNHNITIQTPSAISKSWFNFSDIFDKVALNYKLANVFSKNVYGVKPIDFLVINNYEIVGKRNPHKLYGYLRTPEFSKVLNAFIQTDKLTLKQKAILRIKKYVNLIKSKFQTKKSKA